MIAHRPAGGSLDDFVRCRVDGCRWRVLVRVGYPRVCDDHEPGWGLPQYLEADETGEGAIATRHCGEQLDPER